ncbi:NCS2 family permease [Chitinasiproducens palmae]|uniref:Putative MFS transporter, AGZA family, xanthine/uracil permease n=1 Tax=Chitinasiproducens palmae TaxID=1770053 RepID=A0A1H2PWU8_9BURK|nr:NCS2 family permease [Chitinasiproducens palmae]SDV51438.1 putative MFS transporter, AGZA family, xanthine/uracil permease [Chitinasiproducens palmae]
MQAIKRYFGFDEAKTDFKTELLAGLTTFLTMAYIVFVNPSILADAGMPREAVFVATCLVAAIASLVMGLYANYPIACAPGMGLNAYFAYTVVKGMGFSWQAGLGAVFLSGCLFLLVSLVGLREAIVRGIPRSLRIAITSGIGLFLALIALKSAGYVVAHPATFVALGDLRKPAIALSAIGFFAIVALDYWRVRGAILLGILLVTVLSFIFDQNVFHGVVSTPPSIAPTLFALDIKGALSTGIVNVVLVFFLVELFDATGTLMGVANRAGLLTQGKMARLNRALLADSTAIVAGAMLGTSSTTAFVESASGVQAGGRTGMTAIVVAVLFVLALFFSPLAGAVPAYATAPALLYVACLMLRDLADLDWLDASEAVPAALTTLTMPFTYSIADGVAFGFIAYAVLKLLCGKMRDVAKVVWVIAALFVFRFVYLAAG